MGALQVFSPEGVQTISWDPLAAANGDAHALEQLGEASRTFERVSAQGGRAFSIQPGGRVVRVRRFDATMDHVVLVCPVVGG